MDVTEQSPAPTALPPLTKLPIAQLSPALEELEEKCIHATVTLVWPYSSSTKSLSLLLAEPDFRLRRSNGQVKTVFHGRAAEKVAKSQVGIGDTVRLALKGSEFVANDAATRTPGRCVAWDLHFKNGVSAEITQSSQDLPTVVIEPHVHAPHDTELPPPSTPRVIEIDADSDAPSGPGSWGSPAFLKSARSSYGGTLDTAYHPFTEEDGTVPGKGRKKPRYSLRREDWRILDEPDSPSEREGTVDWDQAIEDELNTEQITEAARDAAQPEIEVQPHETVPMETQADVAGPVQDESAFVKPLLEQASSISGRLAQQTNIAPSPTGVSSHFAFGSHLPTDTPQLRPIPSPGLPIPSPIITNQNAQEYFSGSHTVSRTQTTQTTAAGTNLATAFAQDSRTAMLSARQQQAIEVRAEQPVFSQSREKIHRAEGPLPVTGKTASSDPMELFNSPTFKGHPEFNEPDIEMESENRAHGMAEVEDIADYRSERNGLSQEAEQGNEELEQQDLEQRELEQRELEQGELEQEELEQEDEEEGSQFTPAPHKEPPFQPISTKTLETEYPPTNTSIGASDEQTAEDEPEEYDHHEANQVEAADVPPAARLGPSLSPDYSEDGSHAAEVEAPSDEEDAAEYTSQDDEERYDEGEDGDEFYEDDVGLPQQPRPQNAQPEVIVLDSDSEDELDSDQPAATPPSQLVRRETGYEESFDQSAASAPEDEEQDWSAVDEEPDYDEVDGEDLPQDEESVQDSDLEDESSVDVLARDGDGEGDSSPGRSMEHENDDGGFAGDEVEPLSEEAMQDDGNTGLAPENVIDLSSDVEEPQKAETTPRYDDEDRFRLAASASKGLDGIDERDEAQSQILSKEDRSGSRGRGLFGIKGPGVPSWEGFPIVQTTIGSPPPSTSDTAPVDEPERDDHLTSPGTLTVPTSKPPVPDRHAHGFRSKLSYFAPLATLVDHYNALVDTISVVHETTSIAKATSASKDYYVTIRLTDPSMAGTTLQAQIFRRYRSALPSLVEGNVILLRNFKVRSYDHSIMLVSVESSSWAVFDGSSPEAQMNGPPVEYGSEERAYTSGLRRWYDELGAALVADNKLQAAVERDSMERESTPSDVASSESGSVISVPRGDSIQSARSSRRSRKSHRRVTIHELRDGTRYTEVGSPSSRESIHELRDGTVYANL